MDCGVLTEIIRRISRARDDSIEHRKETRLVDYERAGEREKRLGRYVRETRMINHQKEAFDRSSSEMETGIKDHHREKRVTGHNFRDGQLDRRII